MADPLSIAASILAIATAAGQITKAVSHLRRLGGVPGRIYALRNEVTDLEVILRHVGQALQQGSLTIVNQHGSLQDVQKRAKTALTDLSITLKRVEDACERSKARVIKRTTVWLREESNLQMLQNDIRAVKETCTLMLGASTSHELRHVQLDLHKIVVSTTMTEMLHETHLNSLVTHHAALSTQLDGHYQDINNRLGLLEQLLFQQRQEPNWPPPTYATAATASSNKPTPPPSPSLESLQILVAQRPSCQSWCPCACHAKRKPGVTEPGIAEKVIGKMFIGYAGLPILNRRCDFRGCTHQRSPSIVVEYWFPWWFVAMNIKLDFSYLTAAGPQIHLTTTRRVPDNSPAIACVMQSDIDGLKHLFSKGLAHPRDVSDSRGFTLMRWALYGHDTWRSNVVQFLISQGALVDDISYDNVWDFTFRGQVSEKDQQELRCITNDGDRDWVEDQNFPLVHRIILRLSPKSLIAELEENPMAVYITDASGRTALDWAAARGQDEDLALLLANKADPNTMDITGRTAMLNAADSESCGCLRLLLEAKGDPNPKAVKGVFRSSPLNAAVMRGRTDMLRTLLEFDADPNISNPEGLTPLHNVARFQNADCAMVLLEHGANLNALSKDGTTPLIASIVYNNHGVLQLFLDRCYEYMTSAQIQGPQLLPIIAEYADIKTMHTLASSHPLKLTYDLSPKSIATTLEVLQARRDYDEKLSTAFEELITIAHAKPSAESSIDSLLESGHLFFSARTSFRSELGEALDTLDFSDEASAADSEKLDGPDSPT